MFGFWASDGCVFEKAIDIVLPYCWGSHSGDQKGNSLGGCACFGGLLLLFPNMFICFLSSVRANVCGLCFLKVYWVLQEFVRRVWKHVQSRRYSATCLSWLMQNAAVWTSVVSHWRMGVFFPIGQPWLWWPELTWCFAGQQEHQSWRGPWVTLPIGAVAALRLHGKILQKTKELRSFQMHDFMFLTSKVVSFPQSPFPVALCPLCEIRHLQPLAPGPRNLNIRKSDCRLLGLLWGEI